MNWKAVEEDALRSCACHHSLVDGNAPERPPPVLPLILLAHRGPDVRVHDVRPSSSFLRQIGDQQVEVQAS